MFEAKYFAEPAEPYISYIGLVTECEGGDELFALSEFGAILVKNAGMSSQ